MNILNIGSTTSASKPKLDNDANNDDVKDNAATG